MNRLVKSIDVGVSFGVSINKWVGQMCRLNIAVLLGLLLCAQAVQASIIQTIDFNSLPGGVLEIRLDMDGTPSEPKGYTIDKPARIALDLPNIKSALAKKKHTVDFGSADSVMVLESGDRTRVIINLVELTEYSTRIEGNSLYVLVGGGGKQDFLKRGESKLASQFGATEDVDSILGLDFKRGEEGEGKLLIKLSSSNIAADISKEGRVITLKLPGVGMMEELRRNYDVVDFATPVTMFSADYRSGNSIIEINPVGDFDYLAYQTDDVYVVSVRPLSAQDMENKKKDFLFSGEKLSLNFQSIEVRAVLQLIADFTDLNLVASDSVAGNITLRLENVPWDQALDLVLSTKGLDKRQIGNVLMVAPAEEIAARERQEIESSKQLGEIMPLQTEHIKVLYAEASDLVGLLQSDGDNGLVSERGSVLVDARTNSLLITETSITLEEIRRVIKLVDIPVRQVLIEARIVIANSDFSKDLGIRWGGLNLGFGSSDTRSRSFAGNLESATAAITNGGVSAIDVPGALAVDLGVSGTSASRLALGYQSSNISLAAELSALESNGQGEVVSQPKIITGDKQKAVIKSGQQIPFLESAPSGGTTVKFEEAVLKLEVTPNITPDDRILMDLVINQDSLGDFINGQFNSQIPIIDTTELITQVLVKNGETIVLGGVFQISDVTETTQTPFLGDIPYLGRLFKRTTERKDKIETLIFITPRILSDDLLD
ncbi:MAG: type IV pilus assembly protein PilQ [Flavobacteriales bacterium]|jgi:type IV pilus assembly protein PilQ